MKQIVLRWRDFPEILCWSVLLKPVKKIQVRLKSDKKTGKLNEGLRIFMTTLVTIVTMVVIDSNL